MMSDGQLSSDNAIFHYFEHFKGECKEEIFKLHTKLGNNTNNYKMIPDTYEKSFSDEYFK